MGMKNLSHQVIVRVGETSSHQELLILTFLLAFNLQIIFRNFYFTECFFLLYIFRVHHNKAN